MALSSSSLPPSPSKNLFARLKCQAVKSPQYQKMTAQLIPLLNKYSVNYYVSGHEHALEYFSVDATHYIISGSGSKVKAPHRDDEMSNHPPCNQNECMKWMEKGFFEIEFV